MFRFCSVSFLFVVSLCSFPENRYDPDNPNYIPPSVLIDTTLSDVHTNYDTVSVGTVNIVVYGNDEECSFRWCIDDTVWSAWQKKGVVPFDISFENLGIGVHRIKNPSPL